MRTGADLGITLNEGPNSPETGGTAGLLTDSWGPSDPDADTGDPTKADKTRQVLSSKQLEAVELVTLGKSDREVAELVGVTRQTVCDWRNHDDAFQACLDERRTAQWSSSIDRVSSLVDDSLTILKKRLQFGSTDLSVAVRILELSGLGRACRDSAVRRKSSDD